MPKLILSDKAKKNLRWDAKRKSFVGWQIDVYVNQGGGKKPKRYRTTYPSEAEARSAENRLRVKSENIRLGIEKPETGKRVKLTDLFNKRLAEIEAHAEAIRAARVFNYFLELHGDLEFVDEVRAVHFDAFITERENSKKSVKRSTINREMTPIITAFRRARKLFRELAEYRMPIAERPKFKKQPRQTNISEAEKDAICAAILSDRLQKEHDLRTRARPVVAQMFELAWFLGLRLGEVIKLEKKNFNAAQKTLRAVRSKTGTHTDFDFLPARACEILSAAAEASQSEFIFNFATSGTTMAKIIRQACETCNLTYGRDAIGGITFHSNRHSFTTRVVQVADIATAQSFTSHSNSSMVAYYAHASQASRRDAMAKLYGDESAELTLEKLSAIYEKVRKNEMSFEDFLTEILPQK